MILIRNIGFEGNLIDLRPITTLRKSVVIFKFLSAGKKSRIKNKPVITKLAYKFYSNFIINDFFFSDIITENIIIITTKNPND